MGLGEVGVILNGGVYLLINTFFFVLPRPLIRTLLYSSFHGVICMLILDNHNTMTPAHQKKKKKKHYDTGFKQRKKSGTNYISTKYINIIINQPYYNFFIIYY